MTTSQLPDFDWPAWCGLLAGHLRVVTRPARQAELNEQSRQAAADDLALFEQALDAFIGNITAAVDRMETSVQ